MKSHTIVSQSMMLIIGQYRDKVLDPTFFPSTPEETLHARITATYLLSNAPAEDVQKAADLINRTSTNPNDLERLAALSAKVTYWESLDVIETDQKTSCKYSLIYQSENGREAVSYNANYLTENQRCRFTTQAPIFTQSDKKTGSLTVTKGGFHLLAPKYKSQEIDSNNSQQILRSKL
ncbi:MAG: hypothetical protein P4M14_05035 [Gammaproteobacteria bacterium]|nr:hypothetical protein [Gammaproteobacteria bacterium]